MWLKRSKPSSWCGVVMPGCHCSLCTPKQGVIRRVLTEGIILQLLSIIDLFQLDNNVLSTSSIRTAFSILVAFWTHFSTTLLANLCWDRWRTLPLTQFTGKRNIKTWKIRHCTPQSGTITSKKVYDNGGRIDKGVISWHCWLNIIIMRHSGKSQHCRSGHQPRYDPPAPIKEVTGTDWPSKSIWLGWKVFHILCSRCSWLHIDQNSLTASLVQLEFNATKVSVSLMWWSKLL